MEEADKIASLASGLASRLARVENALAAANTEELKVLTLEEETSLSKQNLLARVESGKLTHKEVVS